MNTLHRFFNSRRRAFGSVAAGALVVGSSLVGGAAFAANSINADASATVVTPISISQANAGLDFGKFSAGAGGTVTRPHTGDRTGSGVVLLGGTTGAAASFTVTGDGGATYTVTLPADNMVAVTRVGGGSMAINGFTKSLGNDDLVLAGGTQTFSVGGVLTVSPTQAAGAYAGDFPISVQYN